MVMYKQNRYCMPSGTYYPGRKARIEVGEDAGTIKFFDFETGRILEEYALAAGIGKCVRQNHPERDRYSKHNELKKRVLHGFGESAQARLFIEAMLRDKPRYTRDQLSVITKLQQQYSKEELLNAVAYCMEVKIPLKYSLVVAQTRPVDVYASLMEGGDAR